MTENEIQKIIGRSKDLRKIDIGDGVGKFGKLTPIYPIRKKSYVYWHCICDCGKEKDVLSNNLASRKTQSCGCYRNKRIREANFEDLSNQRFGRLTVIEEVKAERTKWKCLCDCGNLCEVYSINLKRGLTTSCGCYRKEKNRERQLIDITNQHFGRLTAIRRVSQKDLNVNFINQNAIWECQCECGNKVYVNTSNLKSGQVNSCGCLNGSKGEDKIKKILSQNNINFICQKKFNECKFPDTNALARFDFYLPDSNYLIEYDGDIHFKWRENTPGWNTQENFLKRKEHDEFKNNWCKENNIPLIRIPYTQYNHLCLEDLLLETTKWRKI